MIDGDGKVINGNHKPEDNLNCKDGNYAKHTGGKNTGNIGIAICAMWNAKDYPIKRIQIESACKLAGELSYKYGIRISDTTIMTHSEFGRLHPHTTSYGKIDINNLPCVCIYGVDNVGKWIRNKVNWYRSKIQ